MTRMDLDAIEARAQTARELLAGPVPMAAFGALVESQADVPALVAELRTARESERRANSLYASARAELRAARAVVDAAVPLVVLLRDMGHGPPGMAWVASHNQSPCPCLWCRLVRVVEEVAEP